MSNTCNAAAADDERIVFERKWIVWLKKGHEKYFYTSTSTEFRAEKSKMRLFTQPDARHRSQMHSKENASVSSTIDCRLACFRVCTHFLCKQ